MSSSDGPPTHIEVSTPRIADKGNAEYCVTVATQEMLPGSLQSVVVRWSVYRRYSEFNALHAALSRQYGLLMPELPPKQWFGTTAPEFIIARQRALHAYLEAVQRRCHGVAAFDTAPHLASLALRAFLQWDERLQHAALPTAVRTAAASAAAAGAGGGGGDAKQRTAVGSTAAAARVASRAAILAPIAQQPAASPPADATAAVRAATGAAPVSFVVGDARAPATPAGLTAVPDTMPRGAPRPAAFAVGAAQPAPQRAPVASAPAALAPAAAKPAAAPPPVSAPASGPPSAPPPAGSPPITPSRAGLLDSIRLGKSLRKTPRPEDD